MNNISIDDLLSIIEYCKNTFEQIKNNSECENYVFKKSLRAILNIDKWLQSESEDK